MTPAQAVELSPSEALDLVEQCGDWIAHHAMDEGDSSGRLGEFVSALRVIAEENAKMRAVVEAASVFARRYLDHPINAATIDMVNAFDQYEAAQLDSLALTPSATASKGAGK